jgi:hypothetical protein
MGKIKFFPTFFFSREPNIPFVYSKKFVCKNFSINYINFFLRTIKNFNSNQKIDFFIKNSLLLRKKFILEKKSNFIKKNIFILKKIVINFLTRFIDPKFKINTFKLILHNKKLKITMQDKQYLKKILESLKSEKIEEEINISRKKNFSYKKYKVKYI